VLVRADRDGEVSHPTGRGGLLGVARELRKLGALTDGHGEGGTRWAPVHDAI
jgi:hypothetical protein